MKERRIVIAGYYGFGNAGDEAILTATVHALRSLRPSWRLSVLSANPALTARNHPVEAIFRFNLPKVAKALLEADLFMFGGGSLLQDTTSLRSLWYYLTMLNLPLLAHKQVMVYANGFGPVTSSLGRWGCRHTLNRVGVITLRDNDSKHELQTLGVNRPPMKVTADPAFLLRPTPKEAVDECFTRENLTADRGWLMVSVRDWPGLNMEKLAAILDDVSRQLGLDILFVPMHGESDRTYSHRVAGHMKGASHVLSGEYGPEELLGIIGRARLVLGMRMHAIIFAAVAGVPAVGISYDPKVTSLLGDLQLPVAGHAHRLCFESITHEIGSVLSRHTEICGQLALIVEEKRQLALENIQHAVALIET